MPLDLTYVDQAVERIGRAPDAAIPLLQALQEHYGYLPEEGLRRICDLTQVTPAAITVSHVECVVRIRRGRIHLDRVSGVTQILDGAQVSHGQRIGAGSACVSALDHHVVKRTRVSRRDVVSEIVSGGVRASE